VSYWRSGNIEKGETLVDETTYKLWKATDLRPVEKNPARRDPNAPVRYVVRTFPVVIQIVLFNKVRSDHNRKYKFCLIIHEGSYSLYFWPANFIEIRLMVWEPNHVDKYLFPIMHTFGAPSIKRAWKYRFGINCILCI